jgi:peptidoglycan/xylan/chitin deacetylase (PgdA/CDA1 family)
LEGELAFPRKPIVLTFDDGYEDNYSIAFPLLQKYGMTAVIFLVADTARRTNFWDREEPQVLLMNQGQIHELVHAGIEIGSHTVTHPDLTACSPEQVKNELLESKQIIERQTGKEIFSLAYPYGSVNETIKSLAGETGYTYGIATDSGPLKVYEDFFEIRRTAVFPWTSPFGFWKKTQPWYRKYKGQK